MASLSRRDLLALAARGAAVPFLPMFVAEAAPLTYRPKPKKVADGLWMIAGVQEAITRQNGGAIANITILDSKDGAIIVDTGPSRRFGEELVAVARELTGKGVARVYVTHFHPDHAFGNQAFEADKVSAPQGVIDGLAESGAAFSDAMYHIAQDWMRGTEIVLPKSVATTGVEEIGGRRLHLLALSGHTASDLAIIDEMTGTLVAGDLAFLDRAPTTPHASVETWLKSLAALEGLGFSTLVPGHGPAEQSRRALEQTRAWLTAITEVISRAFEKGLDVLETSKQPLPADLEKLALSRYEFERSVMHFYPRLEAARLPAVGRKINE